MDDYILYASTSDGEKLPVIDVTHPAFAVTATDAELDAMSQQFLLEQQRRGEVSPAVREALSRSILGRALMSASGTFLSGMSTYLIKVGNILLGEDAQEIDRRIAASFPAIVSKIRLQDVARLQAEGLSALMAGSAERSVCLINIAGGPAADSWNALIHLQRQNQALLAGRSVEIVVLDLDDRGPAFGGRAVEALQAIHGPLHGLNAGLRHIHYDWDQSGPLARILPELRAHEAVCGVSSEGGLFEYGSDEAIAVNLNALRDGTASDAFVVGSVTRDCEAVRTMQGSDRAATRPRTLSAFQSLAAQTGWAIEHVIERPFSYNLRMVKS
jgi:hypothetical protein